MIAVTALAGGLGAVVRWLVTRGLSHRMAPWLATGLINVAGAGTLGVVFGAGVEGWVGAAALGLLSGFTTFSTWMAEALGLWPASPGRVRPLIVAVPLALGLAAGAAGLAVGGWLAA